MTPPAASLPSGIVEFRGVGRSYGALQALADFWLRIEPGEFIALLGRSGSGKTTALNCLAGLVELTAGEIRLDGQRIDHLPPEQRGFGVVFQQHALFPHLTAARNIAFGLEMHHHDPATIAARVAHTLALVRLSDCADRLPAELSGGQQQRVAIARAIAPAPAMVLMDEPLASLDTNLRLEMRSEIKRLHQELGSTTIYVTHDQEEALSLADRIVVLDQGRTQQIATPYEIYQHPATWQVAEFMGVRNLLLLTTVSPCREGKIAVASAPDWGTWQGITTADLAATDRVCLGIRPEDLRIIDTPTDRNCVPATVVTCEYEGQHHTVTARVGDSTLFARTTAAFPPGREILLSADPSVARMYPAHE